MQKVLIIAHGAPYGSERMLSALRLATALTGQEPAPAVKLFLMSDAVVTGLASQVPASAGGGLREMVEGLTAARVPIKLCRTCAQARGIHELPLIAGVEIGTLPELAQWTLEADKVITF